jgi:hypothetical protein
VVVKVVYNFGLLILFLIVAITWSLFIELRGGPGSFWVIFLGCFFVCGGALVLGYLVVIKWLCHVMEKYGFID